MTVTKRRTAVPCQDGRVILHPRRELCPRTEPLQVALTTCLVGQLFAVGVLPVLMLVVMTVAVLGGPLLVVIIVLVAVGVLGGSQGKNPNGLRVITVASFATLLAVMGIIIIGCFLICRRVVLVAVMMEGQGCVREIVSGRL